MTGSDHRPSCAVLLAGGSGSRAGFASPKQFVKIAGKELYRHSLDALLASAEIDMVLLAVPASWVRKIGIENPKLKIIAGGARRQDSLFNALGFMGKDTRTVLVHDAARPFIKEKLIKLVLRAASRHGAALAAEKINDTVKETDGAFVKKTLDRTKLFAAQTPQAFRTGALDKIRKLLSGKRLFTDEAAVMEKLGLPVAIVSVESCNMKLTDRKDFEMAAKMLEDGIREEKTR
ncbi:MAG: 2-C-methyl-D-erythritol 4-phosphate cytidylyltransferase [Elusimicrobia bacterium HGW-Elusimicrobia-2]|nr:MAG: 2-C-methyl-D-erythritol 4-phosphate cytidylyltransferase [Elusimicrobia bacterium HGW-Elusimicrobia-2]